MKFRGKDYGKSKFEIENDVNHIEFPEGSTMKSIFSLISDEGEERKTAFGNIVYMRSVLDFS